LLLDELVVAKELARCVRHRVLKLVVVDFDMTVDFESVRHAAHKLVRVVAVLAAHITRVKLVLQARVLVTRHHEALLTLGADEHWIVAS
jgi:hypothetical protein